MPILNVYALPELVSAETLDGGAAVAVDVLRAGTCLITAMHAGAARVIPVLEADDAVTLREKLLQETPAEQVLLGGERHGILIPGFDMSNSPDEYTSERVAGRTLIFSTTNGTKAVFHALRADRIMIGAFVNAAAVTEELLKQEKIHILCAGTNGEYTEEDILFAGLLADRISLLSGGTYVLNAQAAAARGIWQQSFAPEKRIGEKPVSAESLAQILRRSRGGKNLMTLHLGKDILAASRLDVYNTVPVLEKQRMEIRCQGMGFV
ncbi:MAG: 2-phosphosulfolactate phosphatase [Planctomycetaceae bacterium]|jgi:2-phosphosulfolactate phosphatase|nr:2-phosphosulfolactate phosphatase [Planctomycetaceae bacterium]